MNHRVKSAKAKLKKGDLVIVEWIDIQSHRVDWSEINDETGTAQIKTAGFVHSYDGKTLILCHDQDPLGGEDSTPTCLPMGDFVNVVLSVQRVLRRGWEEVWDISEEKEANDE